MQVGIGQWFAFGIGIEPLRVMVDFHSVTEAKGVTDLFDNRTATITFLMSETHIALFDSDSDADTDLISLR